MAGKERIREVLKDCVEAVVVLAEDPNFIEAVNRGGKGASTPFLERTMRQFNADEVWFTEEEEGRHARVGEDGEILVAVASCPVFSGESVIGTVFARKIVTETEPERKDGPEKKISQELPDIPDETWLTLLVATTIIFFLLR